MDWQQWIVWAILAVVVALVVRWLWRALFCRKQGACAGCSAAHCAFRKEQTK
ncbi:MAG: FeoB-associated Cys-rich membrane protein [Alistipes sp.]|nr:FeoB-associated Cys-rich membrane protein [Alistipes sp.]